MRDSNATTAAKPAKPRPDFPLFPHASGRWAKKVGGKLHYFGPWGNPDGALARWEQQKGDLLAGRKPVAALGAPKPRRPDQPDRPNKPHPDFPLFPHASGRWAKKIKGKLHYFGPWADPQAALDRYLADKDDLIAGRVPRSRQHGLLLKDLCNSFLTFKLGQLNTGEIGRVTYIKYQEATDRLIDHFGGGRLVTDITAQDFGRFREKMAEGIGLVCLGDRIQMVRSVFKYGYDASLVDRPVRFGPEFKKPSRKALRRAKAANGTVLLFTVDELKTLLGEAETQLKAMIYLGLNCGFGNNDCAELPITAIDLERGFVDFPRPKTGIPRRCPLWSETLKALREVMASRKSPKSSEDAGMLFITKYRKRWVRLKKHAKEDRFIRVDSVGLQFGRLMQENDIAANGRRFYALRHTFRTIADEVRDRPAVDFIMGHQDAADMRTHYVERIDDSRLQAVVDHVHEQLFPPPKAEAQQPKVTKRSRKREQKAG